MSLVFVAGFTVGVVFMLLVAALAAYEVRR